MKIGFDAKRANANNTGLGNYSRFIVDSLAIYAPESLYQLYIPKRKSNREYDELFVNHPAIEERLPSKGLWRGALSSIWRTLTIKGDLKREGVDIFHGLSNEIPIGLKGGSVRSVVTIHDLIFLRLPEQYRPIDRWIYNLKFRYACRNADRVIAVSECTKRDIVELYDIDPAKIEVIYQGCAAQFNTKRDAEREREVRERYNLPEQYIINVGTLEGRKNLMLCVKSLEHLPDHIHLVAVGRSTPYCEEVMQYAAEKGLTERITLIHKAQYCDIPYLYHCSEVSIYPSFYEGFGIPIIEAMSCGVPVVAATGSCLEEAGGDAAAYVDPKDAPSCAKQIMRFINEQDYRESSITRGLHYVKRFSKERVAKQIDDLYKRVLNPTIYGEHTKK